MKSLILLFLWSGALLGAGQELGLFEGHTDVGITPNPGSVEYDATTGEYRITGSGANMWSTADAFQFVWKKIAGDVTITTDIRFVGEGGNPHRKAALIVRQNLLPDSAYADAVRHGDGLTSIQFRSIAGAPTLEVRSRLNAPIRLRLERRRNQFTMYAGNPGEELKPVEPIVVAMEDPVYIGLAVCSHDVDKLETAIFSNVTIQEHPRVRSKVSIFDLREKSTKVVFTADQVFEAPNWSPDGKYLMINSEGSLYRLPLDSESSQPQKIELGSITGCNNDHGISRDGRSIAFSCRTKEATGSQVYVANADGTDARLLTPDAPSYYHGWSPDGKWLAFVGQRNKNFDIFRVPTAGGAEERLTLSPGYDDGPDYSPDGKWIYLNSDRSGQFQIWRIPAAGAGPDDARAQRVTNDEFEDWFPHPSPNGKWLVFLTFPKETKGHPANQNVQLRLMRVPGARVAVLASLFGGQGTLNVNSWAPDSKRFAFVSYELLKPSVSESAGERPKILGLAHVALYTHDMEKSRAFYHDFLGFEEPYSLKQPDITFFKVNEKQYVELSPERQPNSDRLSHIALQTDDAEGMRRYLASRGVKVPDHVAKGRIGNSNFMIRDPAGHDIEIVQYEPDSWTVGAAGKATPDTRISKWLMHAGIIVTNFDDEMRFYTDVLGFKEIWRGSKDGQQLSWVNLKVRDANDYIELMLYKDEPAATDRGSAHHLCLSVPDIQASVKALKARRYFEDYGREIDVRTGVNRRRQVNLFDPDGTRTELMEPYTIDGKPAVSSTAAPR